MAASPQLSVVMSVYNGQDYLDEAVQSILAQTFKDFEFIIIDDGSTDTSLQKLKAYKDPRIKIISQENKGLVASLNHGITIAKGTYIARQDADDISDKTRFSKQLGFMLAHPTIVLIGSSMNVMNMKSRVTHKHAVLLEDAELKTELLVRSPFAHGSTLFIKEAAKQAGLYRQESWPAEDYDLWLRMSQSGKFANLDEFLYTYRENDQGLSSLHAIKQLERVAEIQMTAWSQRSKLLQKRIDIKKYQNKVMPDQRVARIINTCAAVTNRAWRESRIITALRSLSSIRRSPRSLLSALKKSIISESKI